MTDGRQEGLRIGKYQLLREIAHGGMGVVWEAEDTELRRRVALKVLKGSSAGELVRFQREAVIAAQLRHPNIIAIHDVGVHDAGGTHPLHYIVMPLVENRSLAALIGSSQLSRGALVGIVEDVARALAYAHSKGVLHRDIKPANILVEPDGRALLVDFGLAHGEMFSARLTRTREFMGTPQYMAPEQVRGQTAAIDARTDVYGLGATLYEVLTGRPAFRGATPAALFQAILMQEPTSPRRIRSGISRDVEVVCLTALMKDPRYRYASALEFADDLARARRFEPIRARPPAFIRRVWWWLLRHRWLLASVLIVVIAAGVTLGYVRSRMDRQAREAAFRSEKLQPLWRRVWDARNRGYVPNIDWEAHRKGLHDTVAELKEMSRDPAWAGVAEVWTLMGMAHYLLGEADRAEEAFQRSAALVPASGLVSFYLGKIYLERSIMALVAIEEATREERREKARIHSLKAQDVLNRKGEGEPLVEPLDRHVVGVYQALAREDREEVLKLCEEGLARFGSVPGTEEYWNLRGFVEPTEEAIRSYTHAIDRRPNYAWAYFMRGTLRVERGEWDPALEDLTKATVLSPDWAEAWFNRGVCRGRLRDHDGAIADLTRAIDLKGDQPEFYNQRGHGFRIQGQLDRAEADFSKALALDPRHRGAWNNRGVARWMQKRHSEAILDFTEAIRLYANPAGPYMNRGLVRIEEGDVNGALEDFTAAIRADPTLWDAHYNRGILHEKMGRVREAVEDVKHALEVAPAEWGLRAAAEKLLEELQAQ